MKITPISLSTVGIASLVSITLLSGAILSSSNTFADGNDSSVDNISITVPVACTITPTIDSAHTTTINPNTYEDDIGLTTLKTVCNDSNGYSIYAVGYTNEEFGNTNLIGQNTNQTIATGTATGTNSSDPSNWAMKINAVTGTYAPTIENGFGSYHIVPSTWTKVATFASSTDATIGSSIQSTYAAYISGTQAADTYNGKVRYILVHPSSEEPVSPQTTQANKICYYANASNAVGTMGCQTIPASGGSAATVTPTSATLLASNFSRAGYGFAGWSDSYDYATNPNAKFYGPQEYITFTAGQYSGTDEGLSLYAVWVKSEGSLQDSSKVSSVCSNLTTASTDGTANLRSVSALTDQRDNETYAIAKLADNKCWMIENLRLADKDSSNNDIELSTTNTNSPSLPLTNIYDTTNPTTSNHLSASTNPTSTAWCTSNSAACDDRSMLYTGNTAERGTNPATDANTYSYGNYYNWYSATAGNGKYSTSTNNSIVAGDICPIGWTLPESGDKTNMAAEKNNFYKLGLSLGLSAPANYDSQTRPFWTGSPEGSNASIAFRTYPNNFLYSGYAGGSSVGGRGSGGNYWSKSANSSYSAYYLGFDSSYIGPSYTDYKFLGFSVRCLAQ